MRYRAKHHRPRALLVVLTLAALAAAALRTAPAAPPDPATQPVDPTEVARCVRQLGDPDFQTREQASARLWTAGRAAEEPLREALKSGDVVVGE